jgi:hypothetical protein
VAIPHVNKILEEKLDKRYEASIAIRSAQNALDLVMQRGLKPPLKHGPNVLHHNIDGQGKLEMGPEKDMDVPDDVASRLDEVVEDFSELLATTDAPLTHGKRMATYWSGQLRRQGR